MRTLASVAGLAILASCAPARHEAHADFPHRVKFEEGLTKSINGCSVRITEVWGDRKTIEVGGKYLVRGTYELTDPKGGTLYLWGTAKNWNNSGSTPPHQKTRVSRRKGTFEMWRTIPGPMYPHVQLNDSEGHEVADTYFGHGESLRKRPWR